MLNHSNCLDVVEYRLSYNKRSQLVHIDSFKMLLLFLWDGQKILPFIHSCSLLYLIAIALRFVRLYSIRRCRPLTRLFFTGRAAPKHQPGALTVNPVGEKAGRDAAGCVPSADKTTRLCGYLYKVMPERRQQMKPTSWKNSQLPLITEGWRSGQ